MRGKLYERVREISEGRAGSNPLPQRGHKAFAHRFTRTISYLPLLCHTLTEQTFATPFYRASFIDGQNCSFSGVETSFPVGLTGPNSLWLSKKSHTVTVCTTKISQQIIDIAAI
jgi:hypothetical protein